MKYKIIKKHSKSLVEVQHNGDEPNTYNVKYSEWYEAKRKGKFFGFWHTVGHEYDYYGDVFPHTEKTLEGIEDYVRKWNEVEYFNEPIEIIKDLEL